MFKKRMLLLIAALAAFGAVMVGSAAAWPTGTASINTTTGGPGPAANGNYVIEQPNITAAITNDNWTIPPTGNFTHAGTLSVSNFTSYGVTVTSVTVVPSLNAQCGGTNTLGARFNPMPSPVIAGNTTASATFDVKIGPDAAIMNGCQFNGLVTVNVAQAP